MKMERVGEFWRENREEPDEGFYADIVPKEREVLMKFPEYFEFDHEDSEIKWVNRKENGHITSLDLSSMPDLCELPEIFVRLTHLRYLCINYINIINPDFFLPLVKLPRLRELKIEDNKMVILPQSLVKLKQLTHLTIYCQNLQELPLQFENLEHLTFLDLDGDSFKKFPESLTNLKNLTELYLCAFKMTEMPESIGKLQNLESLNLTHNEFRTLPESIGKLQNLESLNLTHNEFRTLPESFGNLHSLKKILLDNIQTTSLPESFGNLRSLEIFHFDIWSLNYLDADYDQKIKGLISQLPESFGNLDNLKVLKILNVPLTTLPESFGGLKNLQDLKIENVPLEALPQSFGGLKNLQDLKIENAPLNTLPESFSELKNLRNLKIYMTHLTRLPESFGGFPYLEKLDLSANRLEFLPRNFHHFPNLKNLELSYNDIQKLPDEFWALNEDIPGIENHSNPKFQKHISLQKNSLTELPENLSKIRCKYKYDFNLIDNPLRSLDFLISMEQNNEGPCPIFSLKNMDLTERGEIMLKNVVETILDYSFELYREPIKDSIIISYYRDDHCPVDFYLNSNDSRFDEERTLHNYYKKSVRELAEQYSDNSESLTRRERARLVHEASYEWLLHFLQNLPATDPVLKRIKLRFEIKVKPGFRVMLY
ncbi:MAG: leucine-rich repeat domain-containing protein [Promethearchaeota archaeon]